MKHWLFIVVATGWVLTGLVGALAVAFVVTADDLWCEHEAGDSDFGDASWSWWPLGLQCSWTEPPNFVTDHEDPSWGPTVFTALYAAAGVGLVRENRAQRGRRGTGSHMAA